MPVSLSHGSREWRDHDRFVDNDIGTQGWALGPNVVVHESVFPSSTTPRFPRFASPSSFGRIGRRCHSWGLRSSKSRWCVGTIEIGERKVMMLFFFFLQFCLLSSMHNTWFSATAEFMLGKCRGRTTLGVQTGTTATCTQYSRLNRNTKVMKHVPLFPFLQKGWICQLMP